MFASFRRYQKWIWILGVIVIIPSFVIFFSPDVSFSGTNSDQPNLGSIAGKPITVEEFRAAYAETRLSHFFRNNGTWPNNDENSQTSLQRDTVFRVFLVHKLKEMDIHVSDKAVGRLTRERIGDYPYDNFVKEMLFPGGVTAADFERFIHNEAGIQQLVGAAAVSARLLNPREAEDLYRKENQEIVTEAAVFWAVNNLDQINPTPEAVAQFYTNRMALYRVPERLVVSYVEFPVTNFFAEADKQMAQRTNLNSFIDEQYFKGGTNAFKDTNGIVLSEAAAKARLREDVRKDFSRLAARRAANDFGTELSNQQQPSVDKLAAAKGLPVKFTPPFDRMHGLDELNFPPDFRQKALSLSEQVPVIFAPIVGEDAVFVVGYKSKTPSEMPPLEKIKERVTADFKYSQALDMARTNGAAFQNTLTNGLAQKKSFTELCAAAKVKTVPLPTFSPSTRELPGLDERISLRTLQGIAFDLAPGEASHYLSAGTNGGFILYARARLPLDDAKVKTELPDYINRLRQYRLSEAFNQWFRKQAETAQLVVPQKEPAVAPPAPSAAPKPAAPPAPKPASK